MGDLKSVRWTLGGISQARAAEICGVDPRTYRRWENGETVPPKSAIDLLMVLAAGCLEYISPAWRGWRIIDDQLVSPENQVYTAEWFNHMHFSFQRQQGERADMRQQIKDLKNEIEELKANLPKSADVIQFPGKNNI